MVFHYTNHYNSRESQWMCKNYVVDVKNTSENHSDFSQEMIPKLSSLFSLFFSQKQHSIRQNISEEDTVTKLTNSQKI